LQKSGMGKAGLLTKRGQGEKGCAQANNKSIKGRVFETFLQHSKVGAPGQTGVIQQGERNTKHQLEGRDGESGGM